MADSYDVVIVGGGNNGLATAGYLARSGLSVIVLERRDIIGGGAMTEDFPGAEGWRHNTHAQMMMWVRNGPMYSELELEENGLEMVPLDPQVAVVYREGPPLVIYRDIDQAADYISKSINKHDGEAYRELARAAVDAAPMGLMTFYNMPSPPSTASTALEGSREGLQFLREMMSTPERVLDDYFESEQMKALFLQQVLQSGSSTAKFGMGRTPFNLMGLEHLWGMYVAKGGTNSVAQALVKSLESHGGKVVTGVHVDEILVEDGRATGVRTSSGDVIQANKAVVGGAGHWQLVYNLVPEEVWGEAGASFVHGVKRFKPDEMVIFTTHLALNEPPSWKAAEHNPDVNDTVCVFWGLDTVEEARSQVDDCHAQRPNRIHGGAACTHTVADPTLNPSGGHSAFTWEMTVYDVNGDAQTWDDIKDEVGREIIESWREYAPNLNPDNIVADVHYSPLDIERRTISMRAGSMILGDASQEQQGYFRPTPGWSDYRTPIENIYVSSGTGHPFGGVLGAAGRNAAGVIAEDFGVERWWPDYYG